jgi:2,3-dihydroxybiphenyl 1,2-dioxygenase
MTVQAMGYFWVGTSKLDDWTSLAGNQLGLQAVDRGGAIRAFRMDDRKQRLIFDGGLPDGERFFGWEIADATALDRLAGRLENAGVAVRRETAAVADQRCAAEVISFRDPAGSRVEAFHGGQIADEPFRPGRHIGGFRTGTQGVGHAVLMVPDIDAALTFYRDLLGFQITDFMGPPISLYFMHVNTRHHSLAIAQGSRSRMHHLMMEFYSLDDVGQSYDIAQQREDRVAVKFGRHSNDFMTSFYMRTPSNFLIEHGWGGREVSPGWQPVELKSAGSFWGHQGLFETLADGPAPPDAPPHPPMPAPAPNHAPLQVLDGNYERMSGVCPWWDALKRGSSAI